MFQTLGNGRQAGARSSIVGYKDILVHLDGTPEDETRLAHAEALACAFEAHVCGLYTIQLPDIAVGVMTYAEIEDRLRAEGALRQFWIRQIAVDDMKVSPTDGAGFDAQPNLAGSWRRGGALLATKRSPYLPQDDSSHLRSPVFCAPSVSTPQSAR